MNLLFNYRFLKHYIGYLTIMYLWILFFENNYLNEFHWHLIVWWVCGVMTAVIFSFKILNERVQTLEVVVDNVLKEILKNKSNEKNSKK